VEPALEELKLTFAGAFDDWLRLARQGYFDLYILDNWLPDGSGIGLRRAIREFDPHTPILFYSQSVTKLTSPISRRDSEHGRSPQVNQLIFQFLEMILWNKKRSLNQACKVAVISGSIAC